MGSVGVTWKVLSLDAALHRGVRGRKVLDLLRLSHASERIGNLESSTTLLQCNIENILRHRALTEAGKVRVRVVGGGCKVAL